MTVTFDLSATGDDLIVSKIRAYIQDKVEGEGPLPDSGNFQDDELLLFYADEDSHIKRTICAAYEALAGAWASYAGEHQLGPESEAFQQAEAYANRADQGRRVWGFNKVEADIPMSGRGISIPVLPGS